MCITYEAKLHIYFPAPWYTSFGDYMIEYVSYIPRGELHQRVCKSIKKYRMKLGFTQDQLSELINISHDYYRQLESEKGQKAFSFYTLYKISIALNVPIDAFVSDEN